MNKLANCSIHTANALTLQPYKKSISKELLFQCFPDFLECEFIFLKKNFKYSLILRAFQFLLLAFASVFAASNGLIFDCSYATSDYGFGSVYGCGATVSTVDNNEAITSVTDSQGSADSTLQTSDVKWLYLSNGYNLRVEKLPSNLATIFPNLVGIDWMSSKLRTVSPSDFSSYPNLVSVKFQMNMIRHLDGNLFQNNHLLQVIDFSWNSIHEIGPGLLNGLNSLTYVLIQGNICTGTSNLYINPPLYTIADLQRELDFICGPETSDSSSSDACFANCTARAAALETRVNEVVGTVNAPWYYKMRNFLRAVFLW